MLLGTGNRNFASINACGLNQNEAVDHLLSALQAKPDLSLAQAALDFCRLETSQVKMWRDMVIQHRKKHHHLEVSRKTRNNILTTIPKQFYKAFILSVAIKLCAWWEHNISLISNHMVNQAIELYICKGINAIANDIHNSNKQINAVQTMKHVILFDITYIVFI